MQRLLSPSLLLLTLAAGLPAVCVPLPGDAPLPPDRLWQDNPAVLSLAGPWSFQITRGAVVAGRFVPGEVEAGRTTTSTQEIAPGLWFAAGQRGWQAARGAPFPQWLKLDLGAVEEIRALDLQFENPSYAYRLVVEGSTDGRTWSVIADQRQDPVHDGRLPVTAGSWRQVRVTFHDARDPAGKVQRAMLWKARILVARNGQEVSWQPSNPPADDAFTTPDFSASDWKTMPIPGNWEVEGFSRPTYNIPDDTVGLYRRDITVPAAFAGQRVLWHFDGAAYGVEVFVNGHRAGYHDGAFTAWDLDITDHVVPGKPNLLALRVSKSTDQSKFDAGDFWGLGGVHRPTHLIAVPRQHVEDLGLVTSVDPAGTSAAVAVTATVVGQPGATVSVSGRIHDGHGAPLPGVALDGATTLGTDGRGEIRLTARVASPALWTAETPNLHTLVVTCGSERVQQRFGFREVALRNGVLTLNGTPIKLFGVCRHEEWGDVGHALDETRWQRDVDLLKQANINAVRTSHYPPARRFLELCDERGLYVLDEAPACWTPTTDPNLKAWWIERAELAWCRDRNFPSVIAWSIGNESGFGPNNLAAYQRMLALDPTRPALMSCVSTSKEPSVLINDFHYPHPREVERNTTYRNRPQAVVVTEGPHIACRAQRLAFDWGVKDLWGEVLQGQTELLWRLPTAMGGFIWEWQDQGLADRWPVKDKEDPVAAALAGTEADLLGAPADQATTDALNAGLRGDNHKGIVTPMRRPNTEYFHVQRAYAPVMIAAREARLADGRWTVEVENRYAFTDLSLLTSTWQALRGDTVLAEGRLSLAVPPTSRSTIAVAPVAGADGLRLRFVHPDGRTILSTRLDLPGTTPPPAPPSLTPNGPVRVVTDNGQRLEVTAAGTTLEIDRTRGEIVRWRLGSNDLLSGGLRLNLGDPRGWNGGRKLNLPRGGPVPELEMAAPVVTARQTGDEVTITIAASARLHEDPIPVADVMTTLVLRPDGRLSVDWTMTWKDVQTEVWEAGLRGTVPETLGRLAWSRQAQWSDYPSGHIGAPTGVAKPKDLTFRCTKRNLRWAVLGNPKAPGLAVLPTDRPLHLRTVPGQGGIALFANADVAPSADYGGPLMVEHLVISLWPGKVVRGSFVLQAVTASDP